MVGHFVRSRFSLFKILVAFFTFWVAFYQYHERALSKDQAPFDDIRVRFFRGAFFISRAHFIFFVSSFSS